MLVYVFYPFSPRVLDLGIILEFGGWGEGEGDHQGGPPAMPRTLLKVFGGGGGGGWVVESDFSVHLWSKALA